MFPINPQSEVIINARQQHIINVMCRLEQRVFGRKCRKEGCSVCLVGNEQIIEPTPELLHAFSDMTLIERIVGGEPADLVIDYELFFKKFDTTITWADYEDFVSIDKKEDYKPTAHEKELIAFFAPLNEWITQLLDYETWFQNKNNQKRYDAYQLAANLNRDTCCYCNRMYTATVKSNYGKKVMRPVFDHWYPQHKYPLLALSFYNLIPSCTICNSNIKGKILPDIKKQIHPYSSEDVLRNFRFSFDFAQDMEHFKIKTIIAAGEDALADTIRLQKLELLYQAHPTELSDMLTLAKAYTPDYVQQIINLFPNDSLSHKEAYRLAFGTEVDPADFYKRPLSKFRADILTELQLISYSDDK
ncbi:hypothetical protein ACFGVR_15035 [Mucilaginibacter sp. AW1-3]